MRRAGRATITTLPSCLQGRWDLRRCENRSTERVLASIEQFHRETGHVTGLESCQCRKARIVRNHIDCARLVWMRLRQVAQETGQTIYQMKHGLLSDDLRQQLRALTIKMTLA